jgi:hypothetical protein
MLHLLPTLHLPFWWLIQMDDSFAGRPFSRFHFQSAFVGSTMAFGMLMIWSVPLSYPAIVSGESLCAFAQLRTSLDTLTPSR